MEFQGQTTRWSFHDDDRRPTSQSVGSPSPAADLGISFPRLSSATAFPPSPTSPRGSPWRRCSLHCRAPASPSVLYNCVASMERREGNVLSIAVAKGIVFTGSDGDRIRMWRQPECAEGGYLHTGRHGGVRALLAQGSTLFTAHRDCCVRVWSISTAATMAAVDRFRAKKVATLPCRNTFFSLAWRRSSEQHKDVISCMACNHAEGLLYTGSYDRMVKSWSLTLRRCVDSFTAHDGHVNAMLVNHDDGCLFTASSDGSVKVWRRVFGDSSHALVVALRFQPSAVNALALSRSSSDGGGSCFLYSGSSDGYVNVWEKEASSGSFNHAGFLKGHGAAVLCLASAAEGLVFSGYEDALIRVWRRLSSGGGGAGGHICMAAMEGHRAPVRCLAASMEAASEFVVGVLLYSSSMDRMVKVWRVKVIPGGDEDLDKACGNVVDADEMVNGSGGNVEELQTFLASPVLSPLWVEKKLQLRGK